MRRASSAAHWPHGPLPKIVLSVYFILAAIWYESHGELNLTLFPDEWAQHMPNRHQLHLAFASMFAANFVMSVACCYVLVCRLKLIERAHFRDNLLSWFFLSFFLGYPVWCQILALKRACTQGRLKRI